MNIEVPQSRRKPDVDRFLEEFKSSLRNGRKPPLAILEYLGMVPSALKNAVFNPMQVKAIKAGLLSRKPIIVSSPTASGKSLVMYTAIAYELSQYKTCIIAAPMKALVEEKLQELSELMPWASVEPLTSDYEMTDSKIAALSSADVVVTTPESLASRATKYTSEASLFLRRASLLVVDEVHFVGSEGRGATIEIGIVQALQANRRLRPLLMSATVGNVELFRRWLKSLTSREPVVIKSTYRPTKLRIRVIELRREDDRDFMLKRLIERDPEGEFLIFCPTRRQTVELAEELARRFGKDKVAYHNASLKRERRAEIERRFREREIRILTATSTVTTGLNLPAKHVVVYSTRRGPALVDPIDVAQAVGRAGRPKYHKVGYGYVLVERGMGKWWKKRLKDFAIHSRLFTSQMETEFHINNLLHMGAFSTEEELLKWYEHTLRYAEEGESDVVASSIRRALRRLVLRGAITEDEGTYRQLPLGIVASTFYMWPASIALLKKNIRNLLTETDEQDDVVFCLAIVPLEWYDSYEGLDRDIEVFNIAASHPEAVRKLDTGGYPLHTGLALAKVLHDLLKGETPTPVHTMLKVDVGRILGAVSMMRRMGLVKDLSQSLLEEYRLRFKYGVPVEMLPLVRLPGVGRVYATRLWEAGLRTPEDILRSPEQAREILGAGRYEGVVRALQKGLQAQEVV